MSKITIKTNNVPRDVLNFWELAEWEQKQMLEDHSGCCNPQEFCEEAMWVRYRGQVHCLSNFLTIQHHPDSCFSKWDGYSSDSFFSGLVCRFVEDGERVIIGLYLS